MDSGFVSEKSSPYLRRGVSVPLSWNVYTLPYLGPGLIGVFHNLTVIAIRYRFVQRTLHEESTQDYRLLQPKLLVQQDEEQKVQLFLETC